MASFSILLTTYNRPALLKQSLDSILRQTYSDFEILLVDNGSSPPAVEALAGISDSRIRFFRNPQNTRDAYQLEAFCEQLSGSYVLFLADDDALTPHALEIANNVLRSHSEIEILLVGSAKFNTREELQQIPLHRMSRFGGSLYEIDAEEAAIAACNDWSIGPRQQYRARLETGHPSCFFFSTYLLKRIQAQGKHFFENPFFDVGFLGIGIAAKKIFFLDLPLALIGEGHIRDGESTAINNRYKWEFAIPWLQATPLRAPTFVNLAADEHLRVMQSFGMVEKHDLHLRPEFYYRHLARISANRPWNRQTISDLLESLPFMVSATIREPLSAIAFFREKLLQKKRFKEKYEELHCSEMYSFGAWIEQHYVETMKELWREGIKPLQLI